MIHFGAPVQDKKLRFSKSFGPIYPPTPTIQTPPKTERIYRAFFDFYRAVALTDRLPFDRPVVSGVHPEPVEP